MRKQSIRKRKAGSAFWPVLTLVCAAMMLTVLSGCGGSSNGSPGQVPTAVFEGGARFLGQLRAGEVVLRTFSNNTLDGTLIVTQVAGTPTGIGAGTTPLPPGSYELTGTVSGTSFTGQGRFLGTPAFTFAMNGQLPTDGTLGRATLTGSTSAGAFSWEIVYYPSTGTAGQSSAFTFTGLQNSNVTTAPLNNTINNGIGLTPVAGPIRLHTVFSAFNPTLDAAAARTLTVALANSHLYHVGDTLPVLPGVQPTTNTPGVAEIFYNEGAPASKAWYGANGTVKIIAISGQKVTLQLIGVKMQASADAGINVPNQGTGSFILNGTASLVVDKYPLTGSAPN